MQSLLEDDRPGCELPCKHPSESFSRARGTNTPVGALEGQSFHSRSYCDTVPPFVGLQFGHLYSGGRCEEVPKVPSRWPRRRSGGAPCGRPSRDLRPCPKSADGSSMKGMNVRTLASSQTLRSVPVALGVGSPGHRLDRLGPLLHELLTWDLVYRSESGAFLLRDDLQQRLDEMSLLQTRSTTQVYVGRPCEHCGVVAVTRLVDGTRACAACS